MNESLQIADVRATRLTHPLNTPLQFGSLVITERTYCAVEVQLADGTRGTARGVDRGVDVATVVNALVGPLWLRAADAPTGEQWDLAMRSASPALSSGAGLRALSLVDLATHDARRRSPGREMPSAPSATVPPLWVIVGYPPAATPEAVARETLVACATGAAGVKLPIGLHSRATKERVLAAVEAAGPGRVALDLAWSAETPDDAARLVDGFDLAWVEDPFVPGRARDLSKLKKLLDVPLAAGDEDVQLYHPEILLDLDAVDIVRLDALCHGGETRMHRLASQLGGESVKASWHMSARLHAAIARQLPFECVSVEVSSPGAGVDPLDEMRPSQLESLDSPSARR